MRRYAWVTAVCLAALMAGGCGNQTGQETKQNSVSVSESAASGEPEAKSDDVGSDGIQLNESPSVRQIMLHGRGFLRLS